MNIHEYQAKAILRRHGLAVPMGRPVATAVSAAQAAEELIRETGTPLVVVKAQIHAGGRGKGTFLEEPDLHGVAVIKTPGEAGRVAARMLGRTLVTHQTGPEGRRVHRLLIEQGVEIEKELYLGAVIDRQAQRVAMMACAEGGVEIETVAARSPQKILKVPVDPAIGLQPYQARALAFGLGLEGKEHRNAVAFVLGLARLFEQEDASLVEINPLVVARSGRRRSGELMALDAKLNFDDSAAIRHPEWMELQDATEEDLTEAAANAHDLSYVKLDGTIGCMVNGAGLAMATMDIIKQFGGEPANFLDVGGAADKDRVTAAFKIILSDPHVRGVFVNIFGGIVQCDIIGQGIVDAAKEMALTVPLVVRLEGTNVEAGRQILKDSGLNVTPAVDMADGAKKIVELSR